MQGFLHNGIYCKALKAQVNVVLRLLAALSSVLFYQIFPQGFRVKLMLDCDCFKLSGNNAHSPSIWLVDEVMSELRSQAPPSSYPTFLKFHSAKPIRNTFPIGSTNILHTISTVNIVNLSMLSSLLQ